MQYTMSDWLATIAEAEGFDWDSGNSTKSIDKHQVSRLEAEEIFRNRPLLLFDDEAHSQTEIRGKALGKTNLDRHLTVSFTLRRSRIRVISARAMHKKERDQYEKEE